MTRLITIEELKSNGFVNANIEEEYLNSAIEESQLIYLKEIIGDNLYTSLENMINDDNVVDIYLELLDEYIKPYLKYKVLSVLCVPITFKLRNAGVVSQYSNEISTTSMEDTKYIESFYAQKADFFANRLSRFLELNSKSIPEFKCSCNQVTQPNDNHPIGGIYLG